MTRVTFSLSSASVREAIAQLERYRDGLPAKLERMLARLSEEGVAAAVAVVPEDTGELRSSIESRREGPRRYLVVAENGHAAFVEFGTGVVGQGTYPGELPKGWGYDTRRTPEAHDPADPTLWYYYDRDGDLRCTRGRVASGYMLAASEEMRRKVLEIAREVFA